MPEAEGKTPKQQELLHRTEQARAAVNRLYTLSDADPEDVNDALDEIVADCLMYQGQLDDGAEPGGGDGGEGVQDPAA